MPSSPELRHMPLHDDHHNNGAQAAGQHVTEKEHTQDANKQKDAFNDFVLPHQINLQLEVEHQMEILCVRKSRLPAWKIAFLGLLSGFWMALAGCFAYSVAGGIEEASPLLRYYPVAQKLIIALLAPVAMHFIVVFGGEFYSGNTMYMMVGLLKKRITLTMLLYNWASCFLWNMLGCILGVWLFGYTTEIFANEPQLSFIRKVAEAKANMDPLVVFLRAIPGNFMICLAIQMGISARDMFGKIVALHMPLTVYTVAGFEHAIGNLGSTIRILDFRDDAVIVPLGLMYGANLNVGAFIYKNLIPAAVGNAVGGCMIGYIETLLYSWDQGAGNTNQEHNHTDYKDRILPALQIPIVRKATQSAIDKTRNELKETLDAVRQAQAQLEQLQKEERVASQASPSRPPSRPPSVLGSTSSLDAHFDRGSLGASTSVAFSPSLETQERRHMMPQFFSDTKPL